MLFIMKNEELFPFLVEAESGKFLRVQSGVLGFDPYKFILRNLESRLRLESRIQVPLRIPKLLQRWIQNLLLSSGLPCRIYYLHRERHLHKKAQKSNNSALNVIRKNVWNRILVEFVSALTTNETSHSSTVQTS